MPKRVVVWLEDRQGVVFTVMAFAGLIATAIMLIFIINLSRENRHRIMDNSARVTEIQANQRLIATAIALVRETQDAIQKSRVVSCRQTYRSFIDVFGTFVPPPQRNNEQWRKFVRIVRKFRGKCKAQTAPVVRKAVQK